MAISINSARRALRGASQRLLRPSTRGGVGSLTRRNVTKRRQVFVGGVDIVAIDNLSDTSCPQDPRSGPPCSAATACRSPGNSAPMARPPTRTCSPPLSTAWSPGSGWPPSSGWPTRSPWARSTPGSAGAWSRPPMPRSRSVSRCDAVCCAPQRAAVPLPRRRPSPASDRHTWASQRRPTASRHRPVHGRAHGDHGTRVGHRPGGPGRPGRREPPAAGCGLRARVLRRSDHALPRAEPRSEPAAGLHPREARDPSTGLRQGDRATLTAGNSTPMTDGASTVLLATDRWAQDRGLRPLAYAVDGETAAVDFVTGRDPLLTAPVFALPRLLARTGMRLQDFALVENPRGLRRHRPHHARGLGVRRILPCPAGPGCADRGARQQAPECQGLIPRGRAPVRRDWRPNRRVTGKDAAREGNRGAGIDFDLRRGWPRCADDPRGSVR